VLVNTGTLEHAMSLGPYSRNVTDPDGACPPNRVAVADTCPPSGTPPDASVDTDGVDPAAYISASGCSEPPEFSCENPTDWHQLTARHEAPFSELAALLGEGVL